MRRYDEGRSELGVPMARARRRRRVFGLAGVWLGFGAIVACAPEEGKVAAVVPEEVAPDDTTITPQRCSPDAAVSFGATFRPDAAAPNGVVGARGVSDEHCFVGAGWAALKGRQLRLTVTSGPATRFGLCTVAGTHGFADGVITLNPEAALTKLGIGADAAGTASERFAPCGWVAEALSSYDTVASTEAGIGELVRDPAGVARVAFTAPHGGGIETGTDLQVQFLDEAAGLNLDAWFWTVKGRGADQRARLHIAPSDLSEASFGGLAHLANNQAMIRQVVSFHGQSGGDCAPGVPLGDVLVRGGAPQSYRDAIGNVITRYRDAAGIAPAGLSVRSDFTACTSAPDAGAHNYVNRLSDFAEGVQIDQSLAAREDAAKRELVAEAVANYALSFNTDQVLDPGQIAASVATPRPALALGAAFRVPAGRATSSPIDYGTCAPADVAWVDWWRRLPKSNALARLGGGALVCMGGRWQPDAGFQAWALPASDVPARVRVVAHAYARGAVAPTLAVTLN